MAPIWVMGLKWKSVPGEPACVCGRDPGAQGLPAPHLRAGIAASVCHVPSAPALCLRVPGTQSLLCSSHPSLMQ